jgi:hypothetical protein
MTMLQPSRAGFSMELVVQWPRAIGISSGGVPAINLKEYRQEYKTSCPPA